MADTQDSNPVADINPSHGDTSEETIPEAANGGANTWSREREDDVDNEKFPPPWQQHLASPDYIKRTGKRKDDNLLSALCLWVVEHQIGIAVNLLLLLAMTHSCFPRARRHTRKFFQLSYYNDASGNYKLGWDDIFLVVYWIVVFTGLRAAVMDYVLTPLAQKSGIIKKKDKARFAEQAWIFLYYGAFWSLGMYVMYNSNYWLDLRQMWTGWPNREMSGMAKWYYLVQFAFWLQQILIVNIEERRKDHVQMFTHHIITCTLIFTSYGYHQTRVGNVVLCLMDAVDIIFPFAKILKYLKHQLACDVAFAVFIVVWIITRHILFPIVCYSLWAHPPEEINYGCYWGPNSALHGPIDPPDNFEHLIQPFRNPDGLVCWNNGIKWCFLAMLLSLQVIMLVWFTMIMKVAIKVIRGGEAVDSRSDDEGDDEEEDDVHSGRNDVRKHEPYVEAPLFEEEVGVESLSLCASRAIPGRRLRKGGGTASGVTLPHDRKELLGRIGCDKGA